MYWHFGFTMVGDLRLKLFHLWKFWSVLVETKWFPVSVIWNIIESVRTCLHPHVYKEKCTTTISWSAKVVVWILGPASIKEAQMDCQMLAELIIVHIRLSWALIPSFEIRGSISKWLIILSKAVDLGRVDQKIKYDYDHYFIFELFWEQNPLIWGMQP